MSNFSPRNTRSPLRPLLGPAAAAIAFAAASTCPADIIWNEQINGDFSNNRLVPTALILAPGENEIAGRMEDGGGAHVDLDYFSLTIPAGHQLTSMVLQTYLSVDTAAFMAIQPGPIFPNDPETVLGDDLMGWTHFGPSLLGFDLLTAMSTVTERFTPPLPAGTYSLWTQQTDDFTEYGLVLTVDPIPTPSASVLLALGAVRLIRRSRPAVSTRR